MKKIFISFILGIMILGVSVNVNAANSKPGWHCQPMKNNKKVCTYGYLESEAIKKRTFYYNSSKVVYKMEEIQKYGYINKDRLVYNYNSKGKLVSDKYGNASRYVYKYKIVKDSNPNNPHGKKAVYNGKSIKKYDKFGNQASLVNYNKKGKRTSAVYSKYIKKGVKKTREYRYYKNGVLTQKKNYKYNNRGQLKTNKYGKANREIKKYKVRNKKNYNYYIQKAKYTSKGKLKVYKTIYR
ncbi:MAG: hypothetical protein RR543_05850 [Erysipelotrichales bacterium]